MATQKRLIINTRERAVSSDINALQQFAAYERNEVLRALYDAYVWPSLTPGYAEPAATLTTPLRAAILTGVMVQPDLATSILVQPGTAVCVVPALASGDDSVAVTVVDPGVQTAGVLTFTTADPSQHRLDIVEFSVVDTLISSSSRDIYNTTTGLFVPAVVDKVRAPRLSYRIRVGTPGSGLPAMASGWCPIAVICVQAAATSFTQCTFWDVRPLVSDLEQFSDARTSPNAATNYQYNPLQSWWQGIATSVVGVATTRFNRYRVGGTLLRSAATAYANFASPSTGLNPSSAEQQEPGFAMTNGEFYYIAAVFPGGLPRWVKYTDSVAATTGAASRVPQGPRGILVATNQVPTSTTGHYSAITLPTLCGFTASAPGIALAAIPGNEGAAATGNCVDIGVKNGGTAVFLSAPTGLTTAVVTFAEDLTAKHIPSYATRVKLSLSFTGLAATQMSVRSLSTLGSAAISYQFISSPTNVTEYVIEVPLPARGPTTVGPWTFALEIRVNSGAITTASALVLGYYTV